MGKLKRKRTAYHPSRSKKSQKTASAGSKEQENAMEDDAMVESLSTRDENDSVGPFKNVSVDVDQLLKQRLDELKNDDDDARTVVTSKSFRGLNLTKKDKMKIRKEVWKKSEAADVDNFRAVLNHAAFKEDPFATIAKHLENKFNS